ncbi:MAG TPA: TetR/AcrR family transcriptional regulator [Polyangiaceae bacterium]|nr:TetR/AcrR family transcriptional regulator [Polyangiaceae bacterium]
MRDAPQTPAAARRTQRILEAATSLFGRYGFQRTSVDLIAAEAGVAKGTVYAHFDDKEAVFRAVCRHVCDDLLARAAAALEAPGEPVERRLLAALEAKFVRVFELVLRSPHAAELWQSQDQLGRDIVDEADERYIALLTGLLDGASARGELDLARAGLGGAELARLLLAWSDGLVRSARDADALRKALAQSVALALGGLRPPPLAAPAPPPRAAPLPTAEAPARAAPLPTAEAPARTAPAPRPATEAPARTAPAPRPATEAPAAPAAKAEPAPRAAPAAKAARSPTPAKTSAEGRARALP